MAHLHGKGGTAAFANGYVANIQNWNAQNGIETADGTHLGDAARSSDAGLETNSGSYQCIADGTTSLIKAGATGTATFTLGGTKTYAGTILITGLAVTVDPANNVIATYSWVGNGAFTFA